jgi:predicted dithiol-disulfide oxidoreductase (DUF899 family)
MFANTQQIGEQWIKLFSQSKPLNWNLTMNKPRVVSHSEWLAARTELLAKEKAFTRLRDELSEQRRDLPWTLVERDYVFDTAEGKCNLAELFEGSDQLIIYHFMFGPDWSEGCPSCSFWADTYDNSVVHLQHRNIQLAAVSRAPWQQLEEYKKRMGWQFNWVSSARSSFNYDFNVSFSKEEIEMSDVVYNYRQGAFSAEEAPGVSVFYKDDQGNIFHTYSSYSRGLDILNGAYHMMDLTPNGRNERALPFPMAWVRRRDQYED